MFIFDNKNERGDGTCVTNAQLMDIAPTVLNYFGLKIPSDMQGRLLTAKQKMLPKVYPQLEED
jgi:bisphosphoglycerate-independent phosphoglycerate mutase (AlkP superfamily)